MATKKDIAVETLYVIADAVASNLELNVGAIRASKTARNIAFGIVLNQAQFRVKGKVYTPITFLNVEQAQHLTNLVINKVCEPTLVRIKGIAEA